MIITQPYVKLAAPITLDLRTFAGVRPRVITADNASSGQEVTDHEPVPHEFSEFALTLQIDALSRQIVAYLSTITCGIPLYGPDDFTSACADTMEDHCGRVLELLGSDPAATLQFMIDGGGPPPATLRVPRDVANWQAKAVLATMGMIDQVQTILSGLAEPQRTIVTAAWYGNARLVRKGSTVLALAPALGLTDAQLDALFIQAAALVV